MIAKKPRAVILLAAGINRDIDTEHAFRLAGAETQRIHVNDLIEGRKSLTGAQIFVLPGGFSFGDDIASGKVLANKLKHRLKEELHGFINDGNLVLGICNGFQVMVKLGLLPDFTAGNREITLSENDSGRFEDRWVYLKINPNSPCVFTRGLSQLVYAPICHGEGKFVPRDKEVLARLWQNEQVVFQYVDGKGVPGNYPINPNGSVDHVAGICDRTGRLFGLMPHPEDYVVRCQHPRWTRQELPEEGDGLAVFRNAVDYARETLL